VVSTRADAPYRSGRTEAWVKVKCWRHDRLGVVGFVPDGAGGLAKLADGISHPRVGHNEHLLHHRCGGRDNCSRRFFGPASIRKSCKPFSDDVFDLRR
jgi:hypothetical protein